MKKLIPALCMLLVSAMLLGTSTYAWFTMNKTVTATGMQVKARAEGGIVIKRAITSGAATQTLVEFGSTSAVKLLPTSTKDATDWWHAEAAAANAKTGVAASYNKISDESTWTDTAPAPGALGAGSLGTYASGNYYYVYDTFTITPDAQSSSYTDLWVSQCTVSTPSDVLSRSLRIAIVCGGNVVICAPVENATLTYDVGNTGSNNCTAINTLASAATPMTKSSSTLLYDGATTSQNVTVYAYFEGEDTAHTTQNLEAASLEGLTVTVKFTCSSVAASTT